MASVEMRRLSEFRGKVDFGIITMREDEFEAVLKRFPPRWLCLGEQQYNIAELQCRSGALLYAAIVRTAEPGHGDAQFAATHLLTELNPSCLVLIGIGGAKPESEFTLGDVVVGTRLQDFSVTAALPGGKVETSIRSAPSHRLVQTAIANLSATKSILGGWNSEQAIGKPLPPVILSDQNFKGDADWNAKIRASLTRRFAPQKRVRRPLVTAATLGSGNLLMKDPMLFQRWLDFARDLKAVEMEFPGVFMAARSVKGDRPVLAIRGISDVVGFARDSDWTEYACQTAASFARSFLTSGLLNIKPKPKRALGKLKPAVADAPVPDPVAVHTPTGVPHTTDGIVSPATTATPARLIAAQLCFLTHEDGVLWAEFSPDGLYIVTAGKDMTARVWNAQGQQLSTLSGHTSSIRHAAFSRDSTRIVTASYDHTARIWDLAQAREISILHKHTGPVNCAAFSPDGTRIVTASDDHSAIIWNAASGGVVTILAGGHRDNVLLAEFSPDGTRVVTAGFGDAAFIWDASEGRRIVTLRGFSDSIWHAAFSPDGTRIVTGSMKGTPRVFDSTGRKIAVLEGHKGNALEVAFSPDGTRIVSAATDGTVRVWDASNGQPLTTMSADRVGVEHVAFSPDGKRIVTAGKDSTARVWDASTGQELVILRGHEAMVWHAAFSPDGRHIVTASQDGSAIIWSVAQP
jgi:WD40 repeat protein/nucleoside phosphorylase